MKDRYCMVRTSDAGVFAGTIEKLEGNVAKLVNARRIWYWAGAASLSQLANEGTSNPKSCKFPAAVPEVLVFGVIEIIPISKIAEASIGAVEEWRK